MERKRLGKAYSIEDGLLEVGKDIPSGRVPYSSSIVQSDNGTGADFICLFDFSEAEEEHEKNLAVMKSYSREAELSVYAGGYVRRFEDVKKYLYTGAEKVIFAFDADTKENAIKEAAERFGKDKLIFYYQAETFKEEYRDIVISYSSAIYIKECTLKKIEQVTELFSLPILADLDFGNYYCHGDEIAEDELERQKKMAAAILKQEQVFAAVGKFLCLLDISLPKWKLELMQQGLIFDVMKPAFLWEDLKLNSDGMIPVIVQDYKTSEVLMLAYMNEEAYRETLETQRMTYFSRSRKQLWKKGEQSGHYQYVKELKLDCDSDTILAKVSQVGAACHTGSYSCFFKEIEKKEYKQKDITKVLEDIYQVILDRKTHPKEGSYTNYLFTKGIDKILKKVGEEASEIIIAAKNPEPEEIKYEIADFLYHVMVLMAQKGVTWEDIAEELINR